MVTNRQDPPSLETSPVVSLPWAPGSSRNWPSVSPSKTTSTYVCELSRDKYKRQREIEIYTRSVSGICVFHQFSPHTRHSAGRWIHPGATALILVIGGPRRDHLETFQSETRMLTTQALTYRWESSPGCLQDPVTPSYPPSSVSSCLPSCLSPQHISKPSRPSPS